MADLLAWVDAHAGVAAGLAAAWLALQALGVALSATLACCGRRQRAKRPWERVWEEEPAIGARAPLLPRSWDGPAGSSGEGGDGTLGGLALSCHEGEITLLSRRAAGAHCTLTAWPSLQDT